MKKVILISVILAAGSLWANSSTYCNLFECKSEGIVYLRSEYIPAVKTYCDDYLKTDGTYSSLLCNRMDFYPDGTVALKDDYVDEYKQYCPPKPAPVVEEESNWFIQMLVNIGKNGGNIHHY